MKKYKLDWNEYIEISKEAAAEGAVLLKNDKNTLPVKKDSMVAVFGRCAIDYFKSGTGSGGMVNVNHTINIIEGLKEEKVAVYEPLLDIYTKWIEENKPADTLGWGHEPWSLPEMPITKNMVKEAADACETAIVVIGRSAGEDNDSAMEAGSYLLTDVEKSLLDMVCKGFDKVAVVLNVGNIIDMSFMDEYPISAVLYIWHGGMVGAAGSARIISGAVNPSGKLPDTICYKITDYPSDNNFGKGLEDIYEEDIFVGYRYFETFNKNAVRFPFGYGMSYTSFELTDTAIENNAKDKKVKASVKIKNTGDVAGKEVVQVYISAPQGTLGKPARVLTGFEKTDCLAPGKSQLVEIEFDYYDFVSFDDKKLQYVLEMGNYGVYVGTDVRSAVLAGEFELKEDIVFLKTSDALAPVRGFDRMINRTGLTKPSTEEVPVSSVDMYKRRKDNLPKEIPFTGDKGIKITDVLSGKATMDEFVAQLSDEEMASIIRGEGMGSSQVTAGTAAAFGGTTPSLKEKGLVAICCDDGPSGMRLDCGAKAFSIPIGTLLAASFNRALISKLFECLAIEMIANHVECLLGPGINIHRHPLNGRNFEYFSEDPFLTAEIAGAELTALHKYGVEGVIKHFAANNRETLRRQMDSIVSMRALREIYLKAFEIAVKKYDAKAIMTTYGSLNGVWTAGNYDLNIEILRNEWGYDGIVMSDWWAAINRRGKAAGFNDFAAMVEGGNELYMVTPSSKENIHGDNTIEALASGDLTRAELQRNAANICRFVMNTVALDRPEVTIKNRPKDTDDVDLSNVEYLKLEGEASVQFAGEEPKKGTNLVFAFETDEPGVYECVVTASSTLGEVAQLPTTLYENGIAIAQFVFNGSGGKDVQIKKEIAFPHRFGVFRYYIACNGLNIKSISLKKTDKSLKGFIW